MIYYLEINIYIMERTHIIIDNEKITIEGENFTRFSKVFINNKEVDTVFVSNNELEVYNIPKNIVDVKIGQIGLYNKALSYSNVYNISKLDN